MAARLSPTQVAAFRETVSKVVAMLTERGLEVTQEGISAYVRYDTKTGLPSKVNIPAINDNADESFLGAVRGFIDHECAHVLFSDGALMVRANRDEPKIQMPLNILEDVFIERRMIERFPGSAKHIGDTWELVLEKQVLPLAQKAASEDEIQGTLLPAMIHAWAGKSQAQSFMDRHGFWPRVEKLADRLAPLRAKIAGDWVGTQGSLMLAQEMLSLLRAMPPAPPPSEGKGEKGDGKPESSESKLSKNEERKRDQGQPDADKDKTAEPQDDKDDKDDKESQEGQESDEAGDKESQAQSDSTSDEGDSSDSDRSGESDGTGDESGEGDSQDESQEGSAPGDATDESKEGDAAAPGRGGVGAGEDLTRALEKMRDFESMMGEELGRMAKDGVNRSAYMVFSRDHDQFMKPEPVPGTETKALEVADRIERETATMTGQLANQFRRLFAAQEQVLNVGGMRGGRLQASALHRLAAGDDRVFFRREEHTSTDTAVSLLVDCSGSMESANKIDVALTSAYAFSMTLERVGIANEVLGFTTRDDGFGDDESVYERFHRETDALGRSFSRYEPIRMLEFKTFDERLRMTRQRFAAMRQEMMWSPGRPADTQNNVDGESLLYGAQRLLKRRERRKVMIVFSDGEPAAQGVRNHLCNHLHQVVQDITKSGVETLGIGILSKEVKHYYPKHVVLNAVSELPTTVMRELTQILLGTRR